MTLAWWGSPDVYRLGVQTGMPYPGTGYGNPRDSHCALWPWFEATSCENMRIASLQSETFQVGVPAWWPPAQEGELLQLKLCDALRVDDGACKRLRVAAAAEWEIMVMSFKRRRSR